MNALLWTTPIRKATLKELRFLHVMARRANKGQAYLLQLHARCKQPSVKGRLGGRKVCWKHAVTRLRRTSYKDVAQCALWKLKSPIKNSWQAALHGRIKFLH
jgi:hypothetical protein